MKIEAHSINGIAIAEIKSESVIINNEEDALDLLGNLYYQDFDRIIIHQQNITTGFFDLKNGIAGAILQKFSNYRIRLAIVGDYSQYSSGSIRDFIYESNKMGAVYFAGSTAEALQKLGIK